MNIFTKKNALVGYVVLKGLERRRKQKERRRARVAAAVGLGALSVGALAGVAVLLYRKHHTESPGEEQEGTEPDEEIVGEVVMTSTEPAPAT